MPLPSNYSTRTVHGRWIAFPDGAPATGTVTFRASVAHLVSSSDELVILTRPISADLDSNGEATVELPTTSDPDISPTGFTYAVTETLGANGTERAYSIDVPEDTVTLELATVTPVAAADDVSPYLLVADRGSPGGVAALDTAGLVPRAQLPTTVDSVNGETGDVTLNASDVGALPDTFTAPVQSVNTFTGDVSLTASDVGAAGSGHNHDAAYASAGHTHPASALDDLTDVDTSTSPPGGGQALVFDGAATVWEPGDVAEAGHNHDAAYAPAGHGHDYPVDSVDGRTGAVTLGDLYADAGHGHAHPVTSVNTETGDVTLDAADVGASPDTHHHDADYAAAGHTHDHPVDSVDGRTGTVTLGDLYADSGHNHDAAYAAAGHGHDYPVDSVNGETGNVNLSASDVGAAPSGHNHDAAYAADDHGHTLLSLGIDRGYVEEETDADGQIAWPHALGVLPTSVQMTVRAFDSTTYAQNIPAQMTSTQIVAQCRLTSDGSPLGSGNVTGIFWTAFA